MRGGAKAVEEVAGEKKQYVALPTDLRSITRRPDRFLTTVDLDLGWSAEERKIRWLEFGQCDLRIDKGGEGRLEARLKGSTCDFEHDTAWALKLPLIGVQLGELGVWNSRVHFTAWVHPDAGEESGHPSFHVPRPGYNPMEHEDAVTCDGIYDEKKKKYCKWNDGKKHIIVPEGFYVPLFDRALYRAVRGRKVEISIGPALTEDE